MGEFFMMASKLARLKDSKDRAEEKRKIIRTILAQTIAGPAYPTSYNWDAADRVLAIFDIPDIPAHHPKPTKRTAPSMNTATHNAALSKVSTVDLIIADPEKMVKPCKRAVTFDKGQDARRVARNKAAKPAPTQRIEDKRTEEFESCPYCAIRGCEERCQEGE